MALFISLLQIACALGLVALMAVQTDKAEQGGVMGIGGQGGRAQGEIEMAVGPERILKPLTKWLATAFLALSVLAAVEDRLTFWHFPIVLGVYLFGMIIGPRIWATVTGTRRAV